MKKILILNQFDVDYTFGGIETLIKGLIDYCNRTGFAAELGYAQRTPKLKIPKTFLLPRLFLKQALSNADIVHAHWWSGSLSALDFFHSRPFITTIHGTSAGIKKAIGSNCGLIKKFSLFETEKLEKIACLNSDYIIAVSQAVSKEIMQFYSYKKRIQIIPNGVDLEKFHPISRKLKKPLTVGFVGRMNSYEKGFDRVINIIKDYRNNSKIRFVVFGTLSQSQKEQLSFLEHYTLPSHKMPNAYHSIDIFLNPARYEGCELALLEAMASGVVPISTNVGLASEIIKNNCNGFVLKQTENFETELKDLLGYLADNIELLDKMRFRARETAEKFSIKKTYEMYLKVYEKFAL